MQNVDHSGETMSMSTAPRMLVEYWQIEISGGSNLTRGFYKIIPNSTQAVTALVIVYCI